VIKIQRPGRTALIVKNLPAAVRCVTGRSCEFADYTRARGTSSPAPASSASAPPPRGALFSIPASRFTAGAFGFFVSGAMRQGNQSLIACGGSKTVSETVQAPPADRPCSGAGTVCVEIYSISADSTRGVAVAIFVCRYALVADRTRRPAVAVVISADVLTADPACRIAVPISVGVYRAIAGSACRITRSIRVKAGALGVNRCKMRRAGQHPQGDANGGRNRRGENPHWGLTSPGPSARRR
jgi:hypothetical protein